MAIDSIKEKVSNLTTDIHALYLASKEPNVPWYAKALMLLIIGYFLSPIDPIPDFIPVLGELDELIVVPAGIALTMKLIPKTVMEDCRKRASQNPISSRTKWIGAAIIIAFWGALAYLAYNFLKSTFFT